MESLRRIVLSIVRPTAAREAIAREKTTIDALLRRYTPPLSPLARVSVASGAVASSIGLI